MLDAADTGRDCGSYPGAPVGVGGDRQSVTAGRGDGRGERRRVVLRLVGAVAGGHHPPGGHHLDDVHGAASALVDGRDDGLGAPRLTAEEPAMTLRRGDRWTGHEDFRRDPGCRR